MRCPKCVKEGKKSRVYVFTPKLNLLFQQPYYDENGDYVSQEVKARTEYSCSRGHSWEQER